MNFVMFPFSIKSEMIASSGVTPMEGRMVSC